LPKAARDWPKLNFVTYHACIQPNFFLADALKDIQADKLRGGVPNISWTTEYAQLVKDLPNCYAEIGTTWASSVVTFPTVAAHIMGQLMKFMGPDRIVFGSDSVWYGSPQWQIEAFWRFQIPFHGISRHHAHATPDYKKAHQFAIGCLQREQGECGPPNGPLEPRSPEQPEAITTFCCWLVLFLHEYTAPATPESKKDSSCFRIWSRS